MIAKCLRCQALWRFNELEKGICPDCIKKPEIVNDIKANSDYTKVKGGKEDGTRE